MREALFTSADGRSHIEQFDCREGVGNRIDVGAATPVPDATIRLTPDAYDDLVRHGIASLAQRSMRTPEQLESLAAFILGLAREAR